MLQYSWKVRVGSPRELTWELYQFLVERGYKSEHGHEALRLEETPIEGVATFAESLQGRKDFRGRSLWRLIVGVILCLTIVLVPIGWWLIKKSKHVLSYIITVNIEGETYKASARTQDPYRAQSEVLDVASNARIRLEGTATVSRAGRLKEAGELERQKLETELQKLREALDQLIPKIILPEATERL